MLLFVSGTKVKAEGLENIPKDRAVLYVGNHRSYFDIITSYRLLPGITGYVAKKEMAKIPLLRLWMRYIHCLFLDRSNVKEGLKTILAGVSPFCTKMQVSPHDSISLPSIVIVITDDNSYPVITFPFSS
mgnify:CR=1 FL=1